MTEMNFGKLLEPLCYSNGHQKVFDGFVTLAACALAAKTREAEYMEEVKRWQRADLEVFREALTALVDEMESKPYEDVLGGYYMDFVLSDKGKQWRGEFHTPKPVCDLMARMLVGDEATYPTDRPFTLCEPACGAGAMILSYAQAMPPKARRLLHVTAIDINKTACQMCFINTTLWYIPARILHGNTLTGEFWATWANLPFMRSPFHSKMREDFTKDQNQPPPAAEVEKIKTALAQQEFLFPQNPSNVPLTV